MKLPNTFKISLCEDTSKFPTWNAEGILADLNELLAYTSFDRQRCGEFNRLRILNNFLIRSLISDLEIPTVILESVYHGAYGFRKYDSRVFSYWFTLVQEHFTKLAECVASHHDYITALKDLNRIFTRVPRRHYDDID